MSESDSSNHYKITEAPTESEETPAMSTTMVFGSEKDVNDDQEKEEDIDLDEDQEKEGESSESSSYKDAEKDPAPAFDSEEESNADDIESGGSESDTGERGEEESGAADEDNESGGSERDTGEGGEEESGAADDDSESGGSVRDTGDIGPGEDSEEEPSTGGEEAEEEQDDEDTSADEDETAETAASDESPEKSSDESPSETSSAEKGVEKPGKMVQRALEYDLQDMYPEIGLLFQDKPSAWNCQDPAIIRAIWLESRTNMLREWKLRHGKIKDKEKAPKLEVKSTATVTLRKQHLEENARMKDWKEMYIPPGNDPPVYKALQLPTNMTTEVRYNFTRNNPPVPSSYVLHYEKYRRPPFNVYQPQKCFPPGTRL